MAKDGMGSEIGDVGALRLIECNRPGTTWQGNQMSGSIFSHPYSEKISTPHLDSGLDGYRWFPGSGTNRLGNHLPSDYLAYSDNIWEEL